MHAGEFQRILQTKLNTLTPAFMPVNLGKVPNPLIFNALIATEDAGKKQTRSSAKTTE
jgi:hypothetical protein